MHHVFCAPLRDRSPFHCLTNLPHSPCSSLQPPPALVTTGPFTVSLLLAFPERHRVGSRLASVTSNVQVFS